MGTAIPGEKSAVEATGLGGHPRGLFTLFSVEAWERFSFYGMRALLILFMTAPLAAGGLGLDAATAGAVYGIFTASVYLLSLPGGWLADKLIGQQNAVWWGGLLIAFGNLLASIPGGLVCFVAGLAIISCGVGLLKPNVSVMVGQLYDGDTPARRDAGFSIFYFGIYLGAFTSPLVAGTIGESLGYRWGFAATGAAMLYGTLLFVRARGRLQGIGTSVEIMQAPDRRRCWRGFGMVGLLLLFIVVGLAFTTIPMERIATSLGIVIASAFVGFFAYMLLGTRLAGEERRHVFVIMLLCLCAALFTSGLEQAGSTMNLFARDFTDRGFLGNMFDAGEHPATWYQSIGPCFVLILSPMFAAMWLALGARGLNPSTPLKFGAALILLGLSFAVMALAVGSTVVLGLKAVPAWLVTVYFIQVVAELCLSPIGLSAVTKLSPRARGGQMMGMWFLASAAGSLVAGLLGGWVGSASIDEMPRHFLIMAAVGILAGVAMAFAAPRLNRLIRTN